MRILILCHAFNSLSQRVFAELVNAGHEVSVEFDISDAVTREAVALFRPGAIVAPFLKRKIPDDVWQAVPCLIIHPGPPGDRGPNSLDWAVLEDRPTWGVSIILADAELDGGPVLAAREFTMRPARKSSIYRLEVTEAAVQALFEALAHLIHHPPCSGPVRPASETFRSQTHPRRTDESASGALGRETPQPQDPTASRDGRVVNKADLTRPAVPSQAAARPPEGRWRDAVPAAARRIDWQHDDTRTVLRKINSADGQPGVIDDLGGRELRLFNARIERRLKGPAGQLLARCGGAVCRATRDGAVWIGHARTRAGSDFKRPAVEVLGKTAADLDEVPAQSTDRTASGCPDDRRGPIGYREYGDVGVLDFDFYNGAMSTGDCARLLEAWREAAGRPTRVIVLAGGRDFWSNGMDLNAIEAAESPADESWQNINAIDDLAAAIINTTSKLTVSAMAGNAAAGGVFLALAADRVWVRDGVVLNPHYKNMGNLHGSEYWSYLLPRRVGETGIERVMGHRLPMLARQALELGLVDEVGPGDPAGFSGFVDRAAASLAGAGWQQAVDAKTRRRASDEAERPLANYREAELERMRLNFYGFDPSYHVARYRLVHRSPHAWTPLYLARHRRIPKAATGAETAP